jgi:hypothetical protein
LADGRVRSFAVFIQDESEKRTCYYASIPSATLRPRWSKKDLVWERNTHKIVELVSHWVRIRLAFSSSSTNTQRSFSRMPNHGRTHCTRWRKCRIRVAATQRRSPAIFWACLRSTMIHSNRYRTRSAAVLYYRCADFLHDPPKPGSLLSKYRIGVY